MWPTLTGFQTFITDVMEIDPLYLPTASPVIGYAFQIAFDTVNWALRRVQSPMAGAPFSGPTIYAQAVYNLAGDLLLNYAQDQPGRDFFRKARTEYAINKFTPGMIASTSDATSSSSLLNIEAMKNFTMSDLQRSKTPYGRIYLEIAQAYGPSIVGIS